MHNTVDVPNSKLVSGSNGSFLECSPPRLEASLLWMSGNNFDFSLTNVAVLNAVLILDKFSVSVED